MQTHTFKPDLPPPRLSVGAVGWLKANLFSNWFNSLLTLFALYLIWLVVPPLLQWAIIDANWV
ncbi:MAG: amino acid ABC transporter permease, partial [Pseudomonas sp.]|nr:amino acid ABC transporter permease [Pseudomonas sp.]